MPIYEYKCENCNKIVELVQPFNATSPETCVHCGKGPLRKLVSQSSFILKGDGWYKDGYSGPSNQKPSTDSDTSQSSQTESASSSNTSETSTDTVKSTTSNDTSNASESP